MKLTASAFKNGDRIPMRYTCDGANISPALCWEGVPAGTVSLAMICDDPDAPAKTWVHWTVYNIPLTFTGLKEDFKKAPLSPEGISQGLNDSNEIGYDGPCPPSGTHRYFFRLYALDTRLSVKNHASKADLLRDMEGHILGQAELVGTYAKKGSGGRT